MDAIYKVYDMSQNDDKPNKNSQLFFSGWKWFEYE